MMHLVVIWKMSAPRRAVVGVNTLQPGPHSAAFTLGFSHRAWERGNLICFPSCVCMN